jgi:methionyl-tRNA synthetase
MSKQKFYVTTPIYYVNAEPHIGHIYSTLIADVLARWHRQMGDETYFVTGTDEHGQKIQEKAAEQCIEPQQLVDEVSGQFLRAFNLFQFSHDYFIRTTNQSHIENVQRIWKTLVDRGYIYKGHHQGWYSVSDETFYSPAEVCEIDGKRFSKATMKELIWHQEENYLFRLSEFGQRLLDFYRENPEWIVPSDRQREIEHLVQEGLKDLSVSRKRSTCQWAIPVPDDGDQTVYVWLDALSNYLSATLQCGQSSLAVVNQDYWPCDVHVIGKDIIKFHAIYWPAFLLALDLPLPRRIVAHGWWTMNGEKISKSLGNVFDPWEKSQRYTGDNLRYYLLRDTSFIHDGDFSDARMVDRINGELANSLGNLVTRILSPALLNFNEMPLTYLPANGSSSDDAEIQQEGSELCGRMKAVIDSEFHLQRALELLWRYIDLLNRYINVTTPWKLKKNDQERYQQVMYVLLESVRLVGELLQSFMPETSSKIRDLFPSVKHPLEWGQLSRGDPIKPQSVILFKKIE